MQAEPTPKYGLTLVVPVLDEIQQIDELIASLQPLRARGAELIVVDGGSTDGTPQRAAGKCDLLLSSPPGRARQMNLGAWHASAACLLFLHADTRLPGELLDNLDPFTAGWGFFPVRLRARGWVWRMIETGMTRRSRLTGIGTGDQAIFCTRALFDEVGGFPSLPLMEDVALCKRLRSHARPSMPELRVQVSPRRWQANGVVRTTVLMWWLRLLYWAGVPADAIADRYALLHKSPADTSRITDATNPP